MTSGEDKINADFLRKERQKVYDARRGDRLFKLGLCRRCGRKLLLPGYTVCADCLERARDQARDRYWRLKVAGLCPHCGKPKPPDRHCCDDCQAKRTKQMKDRRLFYKSIGVCPACGKNEIYIKGKVLCEECSVKQIEHAERHRRENPERARESARRAMERLKERRRAAGLCPKCGGKLDQGYKTCLKCRIKSREQIRKHREKARIESGALSREEKREKGICLRCGGRTDGEKAYCPECLRKVSEWTTEWHRKRREEEAAHNTT